MKRQNIFRFFFSLCILSLSCKEETSKKQEVIKKQETNYIKIKLDSTSGYLITIPENYQVHHYHGFDYSVDSLIPEEKALNNFGKTQLFFGINFDRIVPQENIALLKDSSRVGKLFGLPVTWRVFEYQNFITAGASTRISEHRGIEVSINAKSYSNIDSLIKIVSSLEWHKE